MDPFFFILNKTAFSFPFHWQGRITLKFNKSPNTTQTFSHHNQPGPQQLALINVGTTLSEVFGDESIKPRFLLYLALNSYSIKGLISKPNKMYKIWRQVIWNYMTLWFQIMFQSSYCSMIQTNLHKKTLLAVEGGKPLSFRRYYKTAHAITNTNERTAIRSCTCTLAGELVLKKRHTHCVMPARLQW